MRSPLSPFVYRLEPGRPRRGFTLLELIVVITIIGILATLVVVRTGGIGPKARKAKIDNDLQTILRVAEVIQVESGRLPESIEAMVNPKDADGNDLAAGLEKLPKDPWGKDYVYELVDGKVQLKCLGADGTEGGDGEAADSTWPPEETNY